MSESIYINEDLQLTDFQPGDEENMVRYLNDAESVPQHADHPQPLHCTGCRAMVGQDPGERAASTVCVPIGPSATARTG